MRTIIAGLLFVGLMLVGLPALAPSHQVQPTNQVAGDILPGGG